MGSRRLLLGSLICAGVLVAGCTSASTTSAAPTGRPSTAPSDPAAASPSQSPRAAASASPSPSPPPKIPVHATFFEGDGHVYGVGMPLIMRFSRSVTDASAIEKAITVRANGAPVHGAWYWLSSTEAHYRPASYWPSRATITVDAPLTDVAAGQGLAVDDSLTLHYRIGPSHVATINPRTLRMTVTNEHRVIRVVPVSLGKAGHRTLAGIKVVESKSNPERMISDPPPPAPGAYNVLVPFSVRVTNSGEFVHAAPWNPLVGQSDQSHGCTNLNVRDASWFYSFSKVGDVVRTLPGSGMPTMQTWDGWGDWNVSWSVWSAGGALRHTT